MVVWADNDEPGRKKAKTVVAKLKGIAQTVRAIWLDRDGKDGAGAADIEIDERRAMIEAAESAEGLSAEIRTNAEAASTTELSDRTKPAWRRSSGPPGLRFDAIPDLLTSRCAASVDNPRSGLAVRPHSRADGSV